MSTNLNPNYLHTNTSKQLLDASYQLEGLTKKFPIDRIMSYKTSEQAEMPKTNREKFVEAIRQGVKENSNIIKKVKKKLKLDRQTTFSKLKGKNIFKNYTHEDSIKIDDELEL